MNLINLTPHVLNVWDKYGVEHKIAPYTNSASERLELRASTSRVTVQFQILPEFEINRASFGEPVLTWVSPTGATREGSFSELPAASQAVLIVSKIALSSLIEHDLKDRLYLTPGELIRNEAGQPIGCKGFEY